MQDVNEALAQWADKQRVDKPAEVPVETKSETAEVTEVPNTPKAAEEPKEQPKTEDQDKEQPSSKKDEAPELESWDDAEETVEQTTKSTNYDFSKLGKALELEEVKSEEELVSKVSQLKSELKTLKETPLSGIPDEFKEVIEVAKTGDWKDYLASQIVDYSKFDPLDEFETQFYADAEKNPKFFKDGKFSQELAEETLAAIPEYLQEQYGRDILYRKSQQQAQIRQNAIAKAQAKQQAAEKALAQSAKSLQELLPFENYGIKFESKHSSQIYQGIVDSKLTKKHLGVSYEDLVRSGADMKAVARTIAASEYAEKMVKFKAQNSKVEAKHEILKKTQNAQIQPTGTPPNPGDPDKKVVTPADMLREHYSSLRKGF